MRRYLEPVGLFGSVKIHNIAADTMNRRLSFLLEEDEPQAARAS